MKQVYLLDKHDLHALRAGEPFEIHVAGQVIVLRSETANRRNGAAPPEGSSALGRGKGVPHRKYTKAFKMEVLAYTKAHDVMAAAKKFKVDNGSIYKWRLGKGIGK